MRSLKNKIETMTDEEFEKVCGMLIKGICIGSGIYFGTVVAIYFLKVV